MSSVAALWHIRDLFLLAGAQRGGFLDKLSDRLVPVMLSFMQLSSENQMPQFWDTSIWL